MPVKRCSHPILSRKKREVILPLIGVLRSMHPHHRIIILEHLDDRTRDDIYAAIEHALCSNKLPQHHRSDLRTKLFPYKDDLRFLINKKKKRLEKKKKLVQLGGGPLTHVLHAAVPLLLDLFK